MSAIGSSMSDPATRTEKTAVMSPEPSDPRPGPLGQRHDGMRHRRRITAQRGRFARGQRHFAMRLGIAGDASRPAAAHAAPDRENARPPPSPTSAQRRRISGDWSEVAVTTTDRAIPSRPRTRSVKSRSSRPRSPTRAITTTSAATPRANLARSEDFPTPEPAKSPIRWPRTSGSSVSKTATPVDSRSPSRRRVAAAGGGARSSAADRHRASAAGHRAGCPTGSMMRPSQLLSGAIAGRAQQLDPRADRQPLGIIFGQHGGALGRTGGRSRRPTRRRRFRPAPGRPAPPWQAR